MREENRKNRKKKQEKVQVFSQRRKIASLIGFLISIILLIIAIALSMGQEQDERIARLENSEQVNTTKIASSEISKNINEVIEKKKASKESENQTLNISENNDNNTETLKTNSNVSNNSEENSTKGEDNFVKPCEGEVIREYSMDRLVYSDTLQEWITHRGIDIKVDMYTEIKAVKKGIVKSIKNDPRYGTSIVIEHADGFKTVYSCLLATADGLEENQEVATGEVIAKAGNSGVFETLDGSHLHFEMLKNDEYVNPDLYIK